jgi:hypothetical protein
VIVPGTYAVRLTVAGAEVPAQHVVIKSDPRAPWTQDDYAARYQLLHALNGMLSQIDSALNALDERGKRGKLSVQASALYAQLTSNPVNSEDTLQRPNRLRERIQNLQVPLSLSNGPPTTAQQQEAAEIKAQFDGLMAEFAKS